MSLNRRERRAKDKARRKNSSGPASPTLPQSSEGAARLAQTLDRAVSHHMAGRLSDAAEIYNRILATYPDQPDALHLLGMVAYQQGQIERAVTMLEKAVSLAPGNADALNNMGTVLLAAGDARGAVSSLRKALGINPGYFEAHNNLGNALVEARDFGGAEAAYRQALAIRPDSPEVLNNLAATLNDQNQPQEALPACARAIELNPEYAEVYNTRGNALGMLGRLDEAVSSYRQAIARNPDSVAPYWHISRIRKFSAGDEDIAAMEKLIDRPGIADSQRMHLSFSLAKVYEDLESYDDAFRHLAIANKLKRATLEFDIGAAEKHFAETKSKFSEKFFTERLSASTESGVSDETPVFVVGMPRSGTTLVEQILSSHADVCGAGELGALRAVLGRQFGPFVCGDPLQGTDAMTPPKIRKAAEEYIAELRRHSASARLITDKMPHNFELIGMIRLMFPKAKVINCKRDSADNCYSLYKVHFSTQAYGYAYEQTEIARYYKLYTDLMAHWERVLPGFVLNVGYEEVIDDQRAATKKLLDFCGLGWDDACMDFHKNARAVKTASFAQVRKPVFRGSVGLWRRYSDHLQEMNDELQR